jgi:hypothetical protein
MINGTLGGFFSSFSGLRQGDPLFPLLFVIIMEVLSRMIAAAVTRGFIFGFLVRARNDNTLVVSHLLFVNDTLSFCWVALNNLRYLRCVLLCFEVVSGLKINMAKFELVLVCCAECECLGSYYMVVGFCLCP